MGYKPFTMMENLMGRLSTISIDLFVKAVINSFYRSPPLEFVKIIINSSAQGRRLGVERRARTSTRYMHIIFSINIPSYFFSTSRLTFRTRFIRIIPYPFCLRPLFPLLPFDSFFNLFSSDRNASVFQTRSVELRALGKSGPTLTFAHWNEFGLHLR